MEVHEAAAACGFEDPGSEGWGRRARPAACKPQIAKHGRRPVISDQALCTCPL